MKSKLEKLQELSRKFNIEIEGIENYPTGEKTFVLANHNCLMDIFYLPMSIPDRQVSVVSSRVVFKPLARRQKVVNDYLTVMPLEANGGKKYTDICLENISRLLAKDGISMNMFPEGGYFPGKNSIYRGKTGSSRILYRATELGAKVFLVPVGIKIIGDIKDVDNYEKLENNVKVKILDPIDFSEDYYCFQNASTSEEKNMFLHSVIDRSMKQIANSIQMPYKDEYMNYVFKDSIVLPNGEFVQNSFSDDKKYLDSYESYFKEHSKKILSRLNN